MDEQDTQDFFGDGGGAYFMDYDGADKMLIPSIK